MSDRTMTCPHCGGAIEVLVPADAVDGTQTAVEEFIERLVKLPNLYAKMFRHMRVVKAEEAVK